MQLKPKVKLKEQQQHTIYLIQYPLSPLQPPPPPPPPPHTQFIYLLNSPINHIKVPQGFTGSNLTQVE